MIKGIIFDLDGVLVSTDVLHFQAWRRLAEELSINDFKKEDNARQKGVSRRESLEIVLEKGEKAFTDAEKITLAEKKNGYYVELLQDLNNTAVLPGVFEVLARLRAKGLLIGIGSVSKNTPQILKLTGLEPYIDQVSCGLDIKNSKPDPEVFLVAAEKLGLAPEECLVVEDSRAGVVAAKAALMLSLGVGPEHNQLGADYEAISLQSNINWDALLGA